MAKEQFTRSKPHVNVMLETNLVKQGFTTLGAYQIRHGLIVTNPQDRQLIAETLTRDETLKLNYGSIDLRY